MPIISAVYNYYKKQEDKYKWGEKFQEANVLGTGKAYETAQDYYQKGRETATDVAKKANMDKPGGDIERFTDWGRKVWHEGERAWFGQRDQRNEGSSGDGGVDAMGEPGTRATLAGRGRTGGEFDEDERRGLQSYNTKTLLTQGQKAKKVTA